MALSESGESWGATVSAAGSDNSLEVGGSHGLRQVACPSDWGTEGFTDVYPVICALYITDPFSYASLSYSKRSGGPQFLQTANLLVRMWIVYTSPSEEILQREARNWASEVMWGRGISWRTVFLAPDDFSDLPVAVTAQLSAGRKVSIHNPVLLFVTSSAVSTDQLQLDASSAMHPLGKIRFLLYNQLCRDRHEGVEDVSVPLVVNGEFEMREDSPEVPFHITRANLGSNAEASNHHSPYEMEESARVHCLMLSTVADGGDGICVYASDLGACFTALLLHHAYSHRFLKISCRRRPPLLYSHEKMRSLCDSMVAHDDPKCKLLKVHALIGVGGYGAVYMVEFVRIDSTNLSTEITTKFFACKLSSHVNARTRERDIWAELDGHANIAPVLFARDGAVFSQYSSLGSLHDLLESSDWKSRWEREPQVMLLVCRHIMLQILFAIHHMHKMKCLHLDLKPSNILVLRECHLDADGRPVAPSFPDVTSGSALVKSYVVALIDFGMSYKFQEDELGIGSQVSVSGNTSRSHRSVFGGTPGFRSPEQIVHGTSHDVRNLLPASDVFSIGILMSILFHPNNIPAVREVYSNLDLQDKDWLDSVCNSGVPPVFSSFVRDVLYPLLVKMFNNDPDIRPWILDIVSDLRKASVGVSQVHIYDGTDYGGSEVFREASLAIAAACWGEASSEFWQLCLRISNGLKRCERLNLLHGLFESVLPSISTLSTLSDTVVGYILLLRYRMFRSLVHNDRMKEADKWCTALVTDVEKLWPSDDHAFHLLIQTERLLLSIALGNERERAFESLRKMSREWSSVFGATSHVTLSLSHWFASELFDNDYVDAALEQYQIAMVIATARNDVEGKLIALNGQARCFFKLKDTAKLLKCVQMYERLLLDYGRIAGEESRSMLWIRHNMATWLYELGKYEDAVIVFQSLTEVHKKFQSGFTKVEIVTPRLYYCFCLIRLNAFESGLREFNSILDFEKSRSDVDDSVVLSHRRRVGQVLVEKGNYHEAMSVCGIRRSLCLHDSPDASKSEFLQCRAFLIGCLIKLGWLSDAVKECTELSNDLKILGTITQSDGIYDLCRQLSSPPRILKLQREDTDSYVPIQKRLASVDANSTELRVFRRRFNAIRQLVEIRPHEGAGELLTLLNQATIQLGATDPTVIEIRNFYRDTLVIIKTAFGSVTKS
eukprot:ANDGO_07406.mRNA.1 hypothetical protein (macronuclear)